MGCGLGSKFLSFSLSQDLEKIGGGEWGDMRNIYLCQNVKYQPSSAGGTRALPYRLQHRSQFTTMLSRGTSKLALTWFHYGKQGLDRGPFLVY